MFESQAGGLFIPEGAGARPGNFVELPAQEIGQSGLLTVPYAGDIRAAGRPLEDVERAVVRRLQDRAIEPQVSIGVVEANSARASIVGDVESAGTITLRNSGDRILDVIAEAGGITSDASATFVTLTRQGAAAKVAYDIITTNPDENIFVAPGDSINVTSEDKSFFAFGASGSVGEFSFIDSEYNLNKAMAASGGLTDSQADPAQVLIYREEAPENLYQMGLDVKAIASHHGFIPTIYRADFRKPDSFFMAQNFHLRDGDVIYVANADSIGLSKFFGTALNLTGSSLQLEGDLEAIAN